MKIDATTLLLIGAAGVAIYFITKPSPPPPPAVPVYNPALYGQNFVGGQLDSTAQDISAGGQAVSSVISALSKGGVI